MSEIYSLNIDSSLLSGSVDSLRNNIGGYWFRPDENTDKGLSFQNVDLSNVEMSTYIGSLSSQKELEQPIDDSTITKNGFFPVRITSKNLNIKDDSHWKAVMLGGSWSDISYPGILNSNVYEYFNFPYMLPYTKKQAISLEEGFVGREISIGYDYSQKLIDYEQFIDNFSSEYILPNYYLMADLSRWEPASDQVYGITGSDYNNDTEFYGTIGELYDIEMLNFISREGAYPNIYELFAFNGSNLPYTPSLKILQDAESDIVRRNSNLTVDYLPDAFVFNPLTDETTNWAQTKMKNMLFDTTAISVFKSLLPFQNNLPYFVNVKMPAYENGDSTFIDVIDENNFSSKFIKSLYLAFQGNVADIQPKNQEFTTTEAYYTGSNGQNSDLLYNTGADKLRNIDYVELLSFCYNNYDTSGQNDSCMFVGENNLYRATAVAESDIYRHVNSKNSSAVLEHAIDFLNSAGTSDLDSLSRLFSQDENYNETLAYRVEKIGGDPTGDSNTQRVLQNFWFVNSNMSEFNFFDSQVLLGKEYTYNVYAYVLSSGYRYNLTDFALTRTLGYDEETEGETLYGVEFYDPETGDTTSEIYDSDLSGEDDYQKLSTTYSTNAQILSKNKFLADCNLNYEPTLKVYEVLLSSKRMAVLDNPGNGILVTPYYIEDDSNRVGFKLEYDSFIKSSFPETISSDDDRLKALYLEGNDLENDSLVEKESISKPSYFEVFRLDSKPKSLKSFDDNIVRIVNLEFQNKVKYNYDDAFFDDVVATNQKYYYLFRTISQSDQISHISLIYEVMLIDDGGYKYAIFNTIHPDELAQETPEVTNNFKKIFQLSPRLTQASFNTDNVDFSQDSVTQKENVSVGLASDPLWDKTFKIRLTSKKTDRKIDLNITYKLTSD